MAAEGGAIARGYRVRVRGADALRARLEQLVGDVHVGLVGALEESAEAVRDDMVASVAVRTGALRESITAEVNKWNLRAEVGPRGRDVFYGYWVEHGHSSMRAQPFAGPAAEMERTRFPERVSRHVRGVIE